MNIEEQANEVIDRMENAFFVEYTRVQRANLLEMLMSLAAEYPAPSGDDGTALIAAERGRQIKEEGWSSSHDDEHRYGELIMAAMSYCMAALMRVVGNSGIDFSYPPNTFWPWDKEWWKPKDSIRDLVRAGALIAAEIDRLKRLETAPSVLADISPKLQEQGRNLGEEENNEKENQ